MYRRFCNRNQPSASNEGLTRSYLRLLHIKTIQALSTLCNLCDKTVVKLVKFEGHFKSNAQVVSTADRTSICKALEKETRVFIVSIVYSIFV